MPLAHCTYARGAADSNTSSFYYIEVGAYEPAAVEAVLI